MMMHFVPQGLDLSTALVGVYEIPLLVLSLLAAYLGSFSGLAMIKPLRETEHPVQRRVWLLFGATAFGSGVFGMHFIGMLAFKLPVAVHYDMALTMISGLPAMLAASWMLHLVERSRYDVRLAWVGGSIGGAGIGLMHYTGMMAMRMEAQMLFEPALFALSILSAMLLAVLAVHARHMARLVGLNPDRGFGRQLAPVIMAAAISSMHYLAMAATRFMPGQMVDSPSGLLLDPLMLGIGLAIIFFILVASFLFALYLHGSRQSSHQLFFTLASPFHRENRDILLRSSAISLGMYFTISWVATYIYGITITQQGNATWPLQDGQDHLAMEILFVCGCIFSLFVAWLVALFTVTRRLADRAEMEARRELEFQKRALDEHAIVSTTDKRGVITY
ncbi:MAG: hypothetical protein HQL80_13580, partial [Magnetococcales bacterium]|nr:hypothetical protein [Magnetococcales bacterium]